MPEISLAETLGDQRFTELPLDQQLKTLRENNKAFASLSPKDQGTVLYKAKAQFHPIPEQEKPREDPGFLTTLGSDIAGLGTAITHPIEAAKGLASAQVQPFKKAAETFQQPGIAPKIQAAGHAAMGLLPGVGPMMESAGESFGEGRPGEGMARAAEILAPGVLKEVPYGKLANVAGNVLTSKPAGAVGGYLAGKTVGHPIVGSYAGMKLAGALKKRLGGAEEGIPTTAEKMSARLSEAHDIANPDEVFDRTRLDNPKGTLKVPKGSKELPPVQSFEESRLSGERGKLRIPKAAPEKELPLAEDFESTRLSNERGRLRVPKAAKEPKVTIDPEELKTSNPEPLGKVGPVSKEAKVKDISQQLNEELGKSSEKDPFKESLIDDLTGKTKREPLTEEKKLSLHQELRTPKVMRAVNKLETPEGLGSYSIQELRSMSDDAFNDALKSISEQPSKSTGAEKGLTKDQYITEVIRRRSKKVEPFSP